MKKIIYSLVIMIAAGSLFTSCVENIEPIGIQDLREAKADYLDALKDLRAADAKVQAANAAFIEAQAAVQTAIAAQEKAKAEYQALLNARLAAQNEQELAEIEAAIVAIKEASAIQSVENQQLLAEAKAELAEAIRAIEAKAMCLTAEEQKVILAVTSEYQAAVTAYDLAYCEWAALAAHLYSEAYDYGCWDYEAIYTDSLNYFLGVMEYWAGVKSDLLDIENEPAQWYVALEEYQATIDSLTYEKIMIDEEAALDMVPARKSFEGFREFVAENYFKAKSQFEAPSFTSEIKEFPTNNWSLIPQFEYIAYPVIASNETRGVKGFYFNGKDGEMGFYKSDFATAENILFGGAIDDEDFGPWMQRNAEWIDNEEFIGLVDIVETLGRDSVLAETTYKANAVKAKKAWDDAVEAYTNDRDTLEKKGVKNYKPVVDAKAKVESIDKEVKSAANTLAAARKAENAAENSVDSAAAKQYRKVYEAVDALSAAVKGIQFKSDSTYTFVPEAYLFNQSNHYFAQSREAFGEGFHGTFADVIKSNPKDFDRSAWTGEDGAKWYWVKAVDYSMSKQDSVNLYNAIVNYAKVREEVLKDTVKVLVTRPYYGGGIENARVSQLEFKGFQQTVCWNPIHSDDANDKLIGTYATAPYGGHTWYAAYMNPMSYFADHTFHGSYNNEYPCYWVVTDNREYKALPVNPYDDAFARVINALSDFDAVSFEGASQIAWYALNRKADVTGNNPWQIEPNDFNYDGAFAWDKPHMDSFYFSELDWISWKKFSNETSTVRFVNSKGEYQIDELLKGVKQYKWSSEEEKKAYEYYVKATLNTMMTLDYVETLSTTGVDVDSLVKVFNKEAKLDIQYKYWNGQLENVKKLFEMVENHDVILYGEWFFEYNAKVYDVRNLYKMYRYFDSKLAFIGMRMNSYKKDGVSLEVAAVKEEVAKYIDARNDLKAKFNAAESSIKNYNKAVKDLKAAYGKYNDVYTRFWGTENGPVSFKKDEEGVKGNTSDINFFSSWTNTTKSVLTPEFGKELPFNWSLETFTKINVTDSTTVADDLIIPTWSCRGLQNYNEKLALALANIEANAGFDYDYKAFYAFPEKSFLIHGGDSYTELVKIFLAKYQYLKYANYTENKEAYDALKKAVEELVAEYNASLKAAASYYDNVKALLEEVYGKLKKDVPAVQALAAYSDLIAETENIANGYYWSMFKHDDEKESEDMPKPVKKPYDFEHFWDEHVTYGMADAYVDGLGTGTLAAKAEEFMGEYIDRAFARDQKEWALQGQINDLFKVVGALSNVYNDALEFITGVESESYVYGYNFEEVIAYIDSFIAGAQAEAWKWQKALDQLAAGYDPNVILSNVAMLQLEILEEQLAVAETALEGAYAQYQAVISKYSVTVE